MSMEYIRRTYGLACKQGQRVIYTPPGRAPIYGTIMGSRGAYLRVRLDPTPGILCRTRSFHPTWRLEIIP